MAGLAYLNLVRANERKARPWTLDELELGARAAMAIADESVWHVGPWVDQTGMWGMDFKGVETHADWLPYAHPEARPRVPRQRLPSD